MSIAAVSWAFKQKVNDPIAKLVLIGIADKYNEERGYAWPSVKWLAEVADCTTRTVQSKIKLLEEVGMLVRIMQRNGKTNDTNHYHIPPLGGG
jgi:pyocin large subunit-like protein